MVDRLRPKYADLENAPTAVTYHAPGREQIEEECELVSGTCKNATLEGKVKRGLASTLGRYVCAEPSEDDKESLG